MNETNNYISNNSICFSLRNMRMVFITLTLIVIIITIVIFFVRNPIKSKATYEKADCPFENNSKCLNFLETGECELSKCFFCNDGSSSCYSDDFFSVASMKIKYGDTPSIILDRIERLLKIEKNINIILTPEFSFEGQIEKYKCTDNNLGSFEKNLAALITLKKGDEYIIHPTSDNNLEYPLIRATNIAKKYKTNLFLASFLENNLINDFRCNPFNTLFNINSDGKIVGRKRKFQAPEGTFSIVIHNKIYRILPLICGDAWSSNFQLPIWFNKTGMPFDIIIHSLEQGDAYFDLLGPHIQGASFNSFLSNVAITNSETKEWFKTVYNDHNFMDEMQKIFYDYYRPFFPYIKSNTPIIISDHVRGIAAVFNQDLKPFKNYKETDEYVIVRIPVNKEN